MTETPLWLLGLSLGLAAGVSPGPLMTLVVTASLKGGMGAGGRVALAPLITDLPVILLCVTLLAALPASFLRGLTALGALLVLYLALRTLAEARSASLGTGAAMPGRRDLWQGVMVNILSPHPWLFWMAVGGPLLLEAWHRHPARGVAFVAAFYGVLVGSKLALAWLVSRGRERLARHWQRRIMAACGLLLLVFALVLLRDAWDGIPMAAAGVPGRH